MKDFEIRCDESRLENNNTLYGRFSLGPFLPGQGTTFGNALRRSLLSELSGLAITAFEVVGVMQEFSTLPGLRESILDLSLNLKQVVLTGVLPCSTPPVGFLKIRGPAIVKATDLKLPAGVYCTSPEQYIATVASNGTLSIKFAVSVGKGHSTQPYALYRSLSKIKLEPTLSPHSGENYKDNDAISLSNTSIYDSETLGTNGKSLGSLNAKLSNSSNETEKTSKKSLENFLLDVDSSTLSNPKNISQNQQNLNSLLDFVDSRNGTNSTSLEYSSIQKQIFQRINPHQVLPIDAVFTPVSKVNFSTQVNDRFERTRENIVLEIWTNGSVHPKRALEEATLYLVQNFQGLLQNIQQASSFYKGLRYWNYLQPVSNYDEIVNFPHVLSEQNSDGNQRLLDEDALVFTTVEKENVASFTKSKETVINKKESLPLHQAIYNLDIGNLDLSLQTFIQLKKANINTLSHLLINLSSIGKNVIFNEKSVKELNNVVNKLGINL